ncbi:hypothetical protein [Micromonospora sp. NPDC023644]|uniref:hypothetical protein n=1 Tax=Micromonospora sp. NPDC023644 TaxID=3154321 RepID=UPI0033F05976
MTDDLERRTAMLLLLPDLMVTEAWPALWRRLAALQVDIVALTSAQLAPAQLATLYSGSAVKPHNRGRPVTSLGWRIGGLDMSVPLVVRSRLPVDLVGLLDQWKGPSGYGLRADGDLREVWPAANRCMSLLHSPDNRELMWRDVRLLFGTGTAERIRTGPAGAPVPAEAVSHLRMYLPMSQERHPYDIVVRTLIRGATLLAYDGRLDTAADRDAYAAIVDRLAALRGALNETRPDEVFAVATAGLAEVGRMLPSRAPAPLVDDADFATEVLRSSRAALLAALRALTDPSTWSEAVAVQVIEVADRCGLHLDPWERHRLSVALAFAPRS